MLLFARSTAARFSLVLLLLLSATTAADEILVEAEADAVVVRSPIREANFLFRAPSAFRQALTPEGFAVELVAQGEAGASARIRLRLGQPGAAGLDAFVRAHESEYRQGYGDLAARGSGGRRVLRTEGKAGARTVLVVLDGTRSYELFLDATPAGSALAKSLAPVIEGFTILDPKGAPAPRGGADAPRVEPETIEHDYYRLKVHKPADFVREEVDPDRDQGIFLLLSREDRHKNRCEIRIRVHLAKALKVAPEDKAQKVIDSFAKKYPSARVPRKPRRTGWPGADKAYKFKLVGKLAKSGIVIEEDWRFVEHGNGRIYEFQVTTYGGAAREFKKEIRDFWRKTSIVSK